MSINRQWNMMSLRRLAFVKKAPLSTGASTWVWSGPQNHEAQGSWFCPSTSSKSIKMSVNSKKSVTLDHILSQAGRECN